MNVFETDSAERFYRAVLSLKSVEECRGFFEDICTIKEMADISQRLDTAFLLDEGMSYQKISAQLGVSTATIGRVNKCLNYGSGGYQTAIGRIKEESK